MTDCCSSSDCKTSHPNKHSCPVNGLEYAEVSVRTIYHHIKKSWQWNCKHRRYFFCDDPDCDVVYFGEDGFVILTSQLRTSVGIKNASENALLCYCFGISKEDVRNNPGIRNFVVEKTKLGLCSCETSNPSGRCCLKSFPRNCDTE